MKRATIKDVAKLAGVDISTVSRVVNRTASISFATRKRVEQAIRELNYRPSSAARAIVTNKTRSFALLVPTLADPNVAVIASGAEERARRAGYSMLVAGYSMGSGTAALDHFFREHRVDGLLLMSPRHLPTDFLRLPLATLEEAPVDNLGGGRLVAEHLWALGHRTVAFVGGPEESKHARERLRGFKEYYPDAIVALGDWSADSGYRLTGSVLAEGLSLSAIFAASDAVALGVMHALRDRGLEIPADISVIGFDDIAMAKHFYPPLTTVTQPLKEVGAAALELLVARIETKPVPVLTPLPVALVERNSTGPKRGG